MCVNCLLKEGRDMVVVTDAGREFHNEKMSSGASWYVQKERYLIP